MPQTLPIVWTVITQTFRVDLIPIVWRTAPPKIRIPRNPCRQKRLFLAFFWKKKVFLAKRSTFAYSMSYIFWKLLFQKLILAINEVFWSILRGVRILLTRCNRIEHKIWHHVLKHCVEIFSDDSLLQHAVYRIGFLEWWPENYSASLSGGYTKLKNGGFNWTSFPLTNLIKVKIEDRAWFWTWKVLSFSFRHDQ